MKYKCFLIEPVFGERIIEDKGWPPFKEILFWERPDTGDHQPYQSAFGIGAMWYARWIPKNFAWDNETEPHLHVMCPNGKSLHQWDIDSRCSNCGSKNDRLHRCWVRHGNPPDITVDKKGLTCKAGAGSIKLDFWHGMLTNGYLVDC